jgi:hypothetical protein
MNTFKPGDKVKRNFTQHPSGMKLGNIGTIKSIDTGRNVMILNEWTGVFEFERMIKISQTMKELLE